MDFVPALLDIAVVIAAVVVATFVAGKVSLFSCASILQNTNAVLSHFAESAMNPPPLLQVVPTMGVSVMHSSSSLFMVLSVATMVLSPVAGLF